MHLKGSPNKAIIEHLGVAKSTLKTWIRKHRNDDPFWIPTRKQLEQPPLRGCKVADVRNVLERLDAGQSSSQIQRETGHARCSIRSWRLNPQFREATLEFDPSMSYDDTDLIDRAVVAHSLCHESSVAERFALLAAVVGFESDSEPRLRFGKGRQFREA